MGRMGGWCRSGTACMGMCGGDELVEAGVLFAHRSHVPPLTRTDARTAAEEMLERALYALEMAWHPTFSPAAASAHVPYEEANAPLFICLFRYTQGLSRRGLHRTALEVRRVGWVGGGDGNGNGNGGGGGSICSCRCRLASRSVAAAAASAWSDPCCVISSRFRCAPMHSRAHRPPLSPTRAPHPPTPTPTPTPCPGVQAAAGAERRGPAGRAGHDRLPGAEGGQVGV